MTGEIIVQGPLAPLLPMLQVLFLSLKLPFLSLLTFPMFIQMSNVSQMQEGGGAGPHHP